MGAALKQLLWRGVLLAFWAHPLAAQTPQLLADGFVEARSVALGPSGRVYVVDTSADVVLVYTADGAFVARWGGSGTALGAFSEPYDIDPTNGLAFWVADAGNRRIQRFSRSFAVLESLPIPDVRDLNAEDLLASVYREQDAVQYYGNGRPVAVHGGAGGNLYVLDAESRTVMVFDERRRLLRAISGGSAEEVPLRDPVDMAVSREAIYVADQQENHVVVFDPFGNFLRVLQPNVSASLQKVEVVAEHILLVYTDRIVRYSTTRRLLGHWMWDGKQPLTDVVWKDERLFALTRNGLYTVPLTRNQFTPLEE